MGYTAPTTRSSGYLVTAANWNTDLVDNITFLANPPACRVYHNTTQSVNDATETTVNYNSERYDTASMHDTVTNNSRITFNTAGLYVVTTHLAIAAGNDYTVAYIGIRLNGATFLALSTGGRSEVGTADLGLAVSTVYKFAAADYVETRVLHQNTANTARNVLSGGNFSPEFTATWIGLG